MLLSFAQPPSQEARNITLLYEPSFETGLPETLGVASGCQISDLCNENIFFKIYVILSPMNEVDRSCD